MLEEMPAEEALREDHRRLTQSFRESVAREGGAAQEQPGNGSPAALDDRVRRLERALTEEQAEVARLRRNLDRVLASPTWRTGSVITSVPRRLRDKWASR